MELKENVLPTNKKVLKHYFFKRNVVQHTNAIFKKFPEFTDLNYEVAADVAKLWIKASLPILLKSRIETKLFEQLKVSRSH